MTGQNNLPIFEPLYSSLHAHTYVCTQKHTVTTLTCTRLQKGYHLRKTSRLHSVCLFAFVITVWQPSLPSLSSHPGCQSPNTVLYASFFGAILCKHNPDPDLLIFILVWGINCFTFISSVKEMPLLESFKLKSTEPAARNTASAAGLEPVPQCVNLFAAFSSV